jgi:hypothetical protein
VCLVYHMALHELRGHCQTSGALRRRGQSREGRQVAVAPSGRSSENRVPHLQWYLEYIHRTTGDTLTVSHTTSTKGCLCARHRSNGTWAACVAVFPAPAST